MSRLCAFGLSDTIPPMLSTPESYGLDATATLRHRVDLERPAGFAEHWERFDAAMLALPRPNWPTADPATRVEFVSLDSVRVVGRLTVPEKAPLCGAVVTTHGYLTESPVIADANEAWLERGLAVLELRVRGYDPSTQDLPHIGDEWILRGLESPGWVVHGAVADVVAAVRALRSVLPAGTPVSMHGESLGGGLAVMAAARLTSMGEPPHRLAIGLPSLGAWTWRRGRYCNGSGGLVNMMLESLRTEAGAVVETMRLADAALHAPDVTCPVLCKLAELDDVVPAPSAAAVYNALSSTERSSFVTPYGHFEGGLANARKHLAFERLVAEFLAPDSA